MEKLEFEQRGKNLSDPSVDVSFSHNRSHLVHPPAALCGLHFKSGVYGFGNLLFVERIDDDRIGEFPGRSREVAQNQNAIIIRTAGDEFFRNKIHTVVERTDEAELRQPME